jgi:hypothetical protein
MEKKDGDLDNILSDYSIWGLFADTMEYIARARTMELTRYGLTREQSHVLRILYENIIPYPLSSREWKETDWSPGLKHPKPDSIIY